MNQYTVLQINLSEKGYTVRSMASFEDQNDAEAWIHNLIISSSSLHIKLNQYVILDCEAQKLV